MPTKKVLIIDKIDNADSRAKSSQLMTKEGYDVDTVHNPDVALQQLKFLDYNVIIIQESPEAKSWQLCEKIRQVCNIPIIVISNRATADTCVKTIKAGADYFLRKQFGPLEFMARVQSLLQRSPPKQPVPLGA
jgi:DNA-binding response OmpR family regulator